MKSHLANLHFPLRGLNRRTAYSVQRPYTTPDARNVRPSGVIEERDRGGQRPGLFKHSYDQISGASNPVRMLNDVEVIKSDGLLHTGDDFSGTSLAGIWSQSSWLSASPTIIGDLSTAVGVTGEVGIVRSAISNLDTAQDYHVEILILPYQAEHWGTYKIFGNMNNTTPDATTDGWIAELTMTGTTGAFSGKLTTYNGGTASIYNFASGTDSSPLGGWFKVKVSGTTLTCSWRGTQLLSQSITLGGSAEERVGFGMAPVDGGRTLVDQFFVEYYTSKKVKRTQRLLVASANGALWRETFRGVMAARAVSGGDPTLATDRLLSSVARGQKLYIADHGGLGTNNDAYVFEETDGATNASPGTSLTSTSAGNFATGGVDADEHVVEIISGAGATTGIYTIASVSGTTIVLDTSPGESLTGLSFRILRPAKIFDPSDDTLVNLVATAGSAPLGCPIVALFRDRLWWAGDPNAPHNIWSSRTGSPLDYDYAGDPGDPDRAMEGSLADAGQLGETVTALIPFSDMYMVVGCRTSVWIIRGDWADRGRISNITHTVGILDRHAWCFGPNGEILFLSRDGLYGMTSDSMPQSMSREMLPTELRDIDTSLYTVQLAYDIQDRGVHIFLTPADNLGQKHWWFDWETKSFWEMSYSNDHEPTALHQLQADIATEAGVILGGKDGYLRRHATGSETDDGTAISSYVFIGAFKLGGNIYFKGILGELDAVMAKGSGDVTWSVRVGDTAEDALAAADFDSGTWSEGMNTTVYPRAGGVYGALKITSSGSRSWAMEEVVSKMMRVGRKRSA